MILTLPAWPVSANWHALVYLLGHTHAKASGTRIYEGSFNAITIINTVIGQAEQADDAQGTNHPKSKWQYITSYIAIYVAIVRQSML